MRTRRVPTLLARPAAVACAVLLARPAAVAFTVLLAVGAPAPAAAEPIAYRPPAPIALARPFEAPAHDYGSGHRGVDLDVPPGTTVVAAADGTIAHAGDVAGTTWVSVDHPDGVTTSYGPLAEVEVARGQPVRAGDRLGVLAGGGHGHGGGDHGLHWGARRDGRYLDPLTLLGPHRVPTLVGPGGWRGSHHRVEPYQPWGGGRWDGRGIHGSPRAERPGFALPPNPNHLVLVGGLNSSTDSRLVDADHLGYRDDSTTRFSYAGTDVDGQPLPYAPADTWDGVAVAAERLEQQLRAQQRAQPFRPVDLVGHSQGGVVILYYLANLHDPFDPGLPAIGNVVTIASPHRGSDLASLGRAAREHYLTGTVAAVGTHLADPGNRRFRGAVGVPLDELRVGSPLLRDLSRDWTRSIDAGVAGPLATGTRVLTLGGASDRVVGTHRASVPGGGDDPAVLDHRVLPGDHDGILHTEAVREVTYRFLQGRDVPDSPGHLQTAVSWLNGTTLQAAGHALQAHDLRTMVRGALRGRSTPPTIPGARPLPGRTDGPPRLPVPGRADGPPSLPVPGR